METDIASLSRTSQAKRFDPMTQIPWDDPQFAVDPADPRWTLKHASALSHTDWYQSRSQATKSAIGLHTAACVAAEGVDFESVLCRGLLLYGERADTAPEAREYIWWEVLEEAQHSLMFRRFVSETGHDSVSGPNRYTSLGRIDELIEEPELLFLTALAGESAGDYFQRSEVGGTGAEVHPLAAAIYRAHIREEARHLAFARSEFRMLWERATNKRRRRLQIIAPSILDGMAARMTDTPAVVRELHEIPDSVFRSSEYKAAVDQTRAEASRRVRRYCFELGVLRQ